VNRTSAKRGSARLSIAELDDLLLATTIMDMFHACKCPLTLHGNFFLKTHRRAIHTYAGWATLKPNLPNPLNHAVIYTSENPPGDFRVTDENGKVISEQLVKDPIRVMSERSDAEGHLASASRINCNKIYIVEKDVRVLNIGMVHRNFMASLMADSPLKPKERKHPRGSSRESVPSFS